MFITLLTQAPMIALVWIVVILLSLTIHEFSHALVGSLKGDKTAELEGRLTLNPISHIDPFGLIPLLLLGFGWAKPVPFNPYNLKDPQRDAVHIALAGPFSNLLFASLAAIVYRVVMMTGGSIQESLLPPFLLLLVIINLFLAFFNVLPIPPLDGSKLVDALLTKPHHARLRIAIATYGPQVLLLMVIVSIFTSFNVFGFISMPAFLTCDVMIGADCMREMSALFF